MKRTIANMSRLALLAATAIGLSAAPAITVETASGYRETTVGVPVTVSGAAGVTAVQFDVKFDPTIFLAGSASGASALAGHAIVSNSPTNNLLRVIIYSSTNGPIANGTIAILPFTISSSAPFGLYSLTVENVVFANTSGAAVAQAPPGNGIIAVNAGIPPRLDALERTLSGDVSFFLSGAIGQSYILQRSADFKSWSAFSTNELVTGSIQVRDSSAVGIPWRFYRAIEGF